MTEIKWQEPPADTRGGRAETDKVAAQLKARPGEWALVEEGVRGNVGAKYERRGLEITRRGTGEFIGRSPLFDIYARFVDEGDR